MVTPHTPWTTIITEIEKFWPNYQLRIEGACDGDIDAAEEGVGFPFPDRYREFLKLFGESGTPSVPGADSASDFRLAALTRRKIDADERLIVGFYERFHSGMDGAICMSLGCRSDNDRKIGNFGASPLVIEV